MQMVDKNVTVTPIRRQMGLKLARLFFGKIGSAPRAPTTQHSVQSNRVKQILAQARFGRLEQAQGQPRAYAQMAIATMNCTVRSVTFSKMRLPTKAPMNAQIVPTATGSASA